MMKKILLTLIIVSAGFLFAGAQSPVPLKDTDAFLKKLEKVSEETTSIQADFTEEKLLSFMKEPQVSSGKFYYKKEGKMRWEQQAPFNYILLVNDEKIRIQEDGKEKDVSLSKKRVSRIKDLMMGMIKGDIEDNPAFDPAYFESKDAYIVKLVPTQKRLKDIYEYIELTFTKDDVRMKQLKFVEQEGDVSTMKFKNEKFNESVSDGIFSEF